MSSTDSDSDSDSYPCWDDSDASLADGEDYGSESSVSDQGAEGIPKPATYEKTYKSQTSEREEAEESTAVREGTARQQWIVGLLIGNKEP
jgi:hypothetical protein